MKENVQQELLVSREELERQELELEQERSKHHRELEQIHREQKLSAEKEAKTHEDLLTADDSSSKSNEISSEELIQLLLCSLWKGPDWISYSW